MDKEKVLAMWADLLDRWVGVEQGLIEEKSINISRACEEVLRESKELDAEFRKAMGE